MRALLLTLALGSLTACDAIEGVVGGGNASTVHTNDDAAGEDPPPPPPPGDDDVEGDEDAGSEPELVTETKSLSTKITVQKGQRSKMMSVAQATLKELAEKKGYTGVRKVKISGVSCTDACTAEASGMAWRKVDRKSE